MKYEDYEIKKIFEGASIGIYGYDEATVKKM